MIRTALTKNTPDTCVLYVLINGAIAPLGLGTNQPQLQPDPLLLPYDQQHTKQSTGVKLTLIAAAAA